MDDRRRSPARWAVRGASLIRLALNVVSMASIVIAALGSASIIAPFQNDSLADYLFGLLPGTTIVHILYMSGIIKMPYTIALATFLFLTILLVVIFDAGAPADPSTRLLDAFRAAAGHTASDGARP